MIIWIAVLVAAATILILFRQRRTESEALEIPSAMVMLFHPTKGEGDLTICGFIFCTQCRESYQNSLKPFEAFSE